MGTAFSDGVDADLGDDEWAVGRLAVARVEAREPGVFDGGFAVATFTLGVRQRAVTRTCNSLDLQASGRFGAG